ncbi:hypothetical protein AALC25_20920 [Lachnospiraceae bacterium 29-84]
MVATSSFFFLVFEIIILSKSMKDMTEKMFSDNNISGNDSEMEENSDEIEAISEEQESDKAKTGDSTVEGSISRGIVSFVSKEFIIMNNQ